MLYVSSRVAAPKVFMSAPAERERLGNDKVTEVQPTELLDVAGIERRHVQQVYDDIATHFSATRYKAWPRVRAFIESLPRYATVVDVGCGNGKYFSCAQNFMAAISNAPDDGANEEGQTGPAYRFVAGVDFSERLLRLALNQLDHEASETSPSSSRSLGTRGRTELLLADARRTAFRNGAFDAAISIAVVHHFATHERRLDAVRELLRLVRPDGLILIYVWAKERPEKRPRSGASDVFIRWEMHEAHDPERRVHHRYYHLFGEGELERLVEEAGGVVRESYFDKENWCVVLQKTKGGEQ